MEAKKMHLVDPSRIVIQAGFNVREDYGDIEELKNSIVENGLRNPIRAFHNEADDTYTLIDGHRRFSAIQKAIEEGCEIKRIETIIVPENYTEESRTIDLLICNDSKPLNALEQSKVYQRLINFGWKESEIAKKTGRSLMTVYNFLLIANAPTEIKNVIGENKISPSLAIEILRDNKDDKKQIKLIRSAIEKAEKEGKSKATKRHLDNQEEISPNSENEKSPALNIKNMNVINYLSSISLNFNDAGIDNDKTDTLYFIVQLLNNNGNISEEELINFFK